LAGGESQIKKKIGRASRIPRGLCCTIGRVCILCKSASRADGRKRLGSFIATDSSGEASDRKGPSHQRPESTYCGHRRPRRWTGQLGGERAYKGRLGKDRNLGETRHSIASA